MEHIKDPQQELFTAYKVNLEAKGYDVYDGCLPPKETPYPFIYLGDFRQADAMYKNAITGTVYPTIHVWHNDPGQRGTVSNMLADIKATIYKTARTENFGWLVQSVDSRIIPDNTTKTPLLHGIVEAGLKFS